MFASSTMTRAPSRPYALQMPWPMPEPPHRYNRMHNVVPNSKSFAYHLTKHCRELGVDIRLNTATEKLVVENGRVTERWDIVARDRVLTV